MNRQLISTFCDDIRYEVGNKRSFMGIYNGVLYLPSFPHVLPKLCLNIQAVTPSKQPFCALTFRLLKDDEIIAEIALKEAMLSAQKNEIPIIDDAAHLQRVFTVASDLVLSPFSVDASCILRVRADADGEELKALGLIIEAASSESLPAS